jgi:hypothetical protein
MMRAQRPAASEFSCFRLPKASLMQMQIEMRALFRLDIASVLAHKQKQRQEDGYERDYLVRF